MIMEILRDIVSPDSSLVDRFIATVFAVLMFIAIGLLVLLALSLVDSVGIKPSKSVVTQIEQKYVDPAHDTHSYILVGKVMVPQTTHHAESYHLSVIIDDEECDIPVDREFFDRISIGDNAKVDYGIGRITGKHIPTSIELVNGK